jgi:hypothetical protein
MHTRELVLLSLLLLSCGGQSADTATGAPVTVASTSTSTTGQAAERHRIVLHRPHAVGDRAEGTFRARSDTSQSVTVDGQTVDNEVEAIDITLVAEMVIREVNAQGKATRTELTVRQCTSDTFASHELLPQGSVIVVTAAPPPAAGAITLVGGTLTEEQEERLDLVLSTSVSQINDDDVFGSDEPRAVGESWSIDSELAARALSKIDKLTFTADALSGGTLFTGIDTVDGVPCQRVEATMRAQRFDLSGLPESAVVESASVEMQMNAALPVDTSMHRLRSEEGMRMQMTVRFPTDDGRTAIMTVDNHRIATREIRP